MKRIYTYLLLIACAAMFAGCQKDFDGILNAEIEGYNGATDGKVYINDKYACWNDGDLVRVNEENCRVSIRGNSATIQTNINSEPQHGYTAIFPAQYAVAKNQYQLPQTQIYRTVTVGNQQLQKVDAPMVAYTEGTVDDQNHPTMIFKNAGALINVTVKNTTNETINLRYIELIGNTTLWGTVTYTQGINEAPTMSSIVNDDSHHNIITFSFDQEPAVLSTQESKTFYVAVPTVSTTLQPKVYYTTDGDSNTLKYYINASKEASGAKTINRSKISTMDLSSITFDLTTDKVNQFGDGSKENPWQIYTYDEFKNNIQDRSENYYKQMADIERPIDALGQHIAGPGRFMGTYDGNNHTIKITVKKNCGNRSGVFASLSYNAYVKNLIIDANIQADINTYGDKTGALADNFAGDDNRNDMNVTIENCTVKGTIDGMRNVGGLIGDMGSRTGCTVKNCVNEATINGYYDMLNEKNTSYVGGMIGTPSTDVHFINCVNKGNLTGRHAGSMYGYKGENTTVEVDNCTNTGTLTSYSNSRKTFLPNY